MTGKSCPNCSAPITSEICPYCGTNFIDFASMKVEEPFWMKVDTGKGVIKARVYPQGFSIECRTHDLSVIRAEFAVIEAEMAVG